MAFCTLVSNALVNPPIADTTTTGRNGTAALTTAATLRKALASSTDVPPNFMMVGLINIFGVRRHSEAATALWIGVPPSGGAGFLKSRLKAELRTAAPP